MSDTSAIYGYMRVTQDGKVLWSEVLSQNVSGEPVRVPLEGPLRDWWDSLREMISNE